MRESRKMASVSGSNLDRFVHLCQPGLADDLDAVFLGYDPTKLGIELYKCSQAESRDTLDVAAKHSVALVVNGKVFVAYVSKLTVYGLLP